MSEKQTQKEAVFQAMVNVVGTQEEAYAPTKEQRAQVNNILFEGFRNGTIELDKSDMSDSKLKSYVSGLQSNWLRKDTRLNGGTKYVAKNPGSRAGSGDASLKAMRTLLASVKTDEERAEIQGYIDIRLSEISASKAKTVTIDYSVLPADLAAKFSK